jgi:hypothetical protein
MANIQYNIIVINDNGVISTSKVHTAVSVVTKFGSAIVHYDNTKFRQNPSYDSRDNRRGQAHGHRDVISLICLY